MSKVLNNKKCGFLSIMEFIIFYIQVSHILQTTVKPRNLHVPENYNLVKDQTKSQESQESKESQESQESRESKESKRNKGQRVVKVKRVKGKKTPKNLRNKKSKPQWCRCRLGIKKLAKKTLYKTHFKTTSVSGLFWSLLGFLRILLIITFSSLL